MRFELITVYWYYRIMVYCSYDLQYELYYDKHGIYFMNDCWQKVIKRVYDTHPMPLLSW